MDRQAGINVYLIEELGDARLRLEQLKRYVDQAKTLIDKSSHREHFMEVAGHLIEGIPQALFKLDKALAATAMAVSKVDYEDLKQQLRPEKADELDDVLRDVRVRIDRRSDMSGIEEKIRGLVAYIESGDRPPSRDKVVADLTDILAGAGEEFQKVNPAITDEQVARIDAMHTEHKDNFKSAGVPVSKIHAAMLDQWEKGQADGKAVAAQGDEASNEMRADYAIGQMFVNASALRQDAKVAEDWADQKRLMHCEHLWRDMSGNLSATIYWMGYVNALAKAPGVVDNFDIRTATRLELTADDATAEPESEQGDKTAAAKPAGAVIVDLMNGADKLYDVRVPLRKVRETVQGLYEDAMGVSGFSGYRNPEVMKVRDAIQDLDQQIGNVARQMENLGRTVDRSTKTAADETAATSETAEEAKRSRFEEGKPADPTENMSDEDKAKWKAQNDAHKDEFKGKEAAGGDPRWLHAKYPGKAEDGTPFKKGDMILYWPRTKTIMVGQKAQDAWRRFESEIEDEALYNRMASGDETSSEDKESKFEEGKPADPTENMSKEDKAKWKAQNDAHKDEFKAASSDDWRA